MSDMRRWLLGTAYFVFVNVVTDAKPPISYHMASALSPAELRILDLKAQNGDKNAAFRLALYYSSIEKHLGRREHYLVIATKNGSFESIEALADFYAMPGGRFSFSKAISLRAKLKQRFPDRTDNIAWAEACAYDYHWRSPWIDRKKERMFLNLAKSWRTETKRRIRSNY